MYDLLMGKLSKPSAKYKCLYYLADINIMDLSMS